ncbi:MAG: argininosuccinate synthase [Rhodothermales bacterium]
MSIVLAYSGGLDTSFCIPWLKENTGQDVIAVTVNTGSVGEGDIDSFRARAMELGAADYVVVDARRDLYDRILSYLIKGNVLRGGVYPLCVGPERVIQADHTVRLALERGAKAIAHGSTGAGNDQVRFDVALRLLGPDIDIIAPIRDEGFSRAYTTGYLRERGFDVPAKKTTYSINAGLWGTTIGGKETAGTTEPLPEDAYTLTAGPDEWPTEAETITIRYEQGHPVAVNGTEMDPISLIEHLNKIGAKHGVGRGNHIGDTILGIKGRVGFEAPAPDILIRSHRELEKVVLTKWQRYQKDQLGEFYGMLLHEAGYYDPVMRDIEAFLDSSQGRVSGTVTVRLFAGHAEVTGCESPASLFDTGVAVYGEENALWSGADAKGFSRIAGVQQYLAATVGRKMEEVGS